MTQKPQVRISHDQWMSIATEEYRRIDEILGTLTPAQWDAPTDCADWTVRDMVAHLIGAAEATAALREQLRQQRLGHRSKGERLALDAVNAIQVRERAGLGPVELREQLADAGRRGVRTRARIPAPVRALRFPFPAPLGWASVGYLNDTVYTRDAWMHRIDICRAIGADPQLSADHDGRIVADAARAWQQATRADGMVLTGPAGTTSGAPGSDTTTYDGVEFARALAGRAHLPGIAPDVVVF